MYLTDAGVACRVDRSNQLVHGALRHLLTLVHHIGLTMLYITDLL